MIVPLAEQFGPPGELPAEAPPVVEPPTKPETVDELKAAFVRLTKDNAAMAAKIAQLEAPPVENWIELKRAAPTPSKSGCEWLRRRVRAQAVEGKKEGGQWYVNENGPKLQACLKKRQRAK